MKLEKAGRTIIYFVESNINLRLSMKKIKFTTNTLTVIVYLYLCFLLFNCVTASVLYRNIYLQTLFIFLAIVLSVIVILGAIYFIEIIPLGNVSAYKRERVNYIAITLGVFVLVGIIYLAMAILRNATLI